jgi:hypothetical protein
MSRFMDMAQDRAQLFALVLVVFDFRFLLPQNQLMNNIISPVTLNHFYVVISR